MDDEFVEPVGDVPPEMRVEGYGSSRPRPRDETAATLEGEVLSVQHKAGHHEGAHVLDTSVGAHEFDEIVVRIRKGDTSGLVGKRVRIQYVP